MLEKSEFQTMEPSLSLYNYMKIYDMVNAPFKVKLK